MKFNTLILALISVGLMVSTSRADAPNAELQAHIEKCRNNTSCSVTVLPEQIVFIIKVNGHTTRLECETDGTCVKLLSRGQRMKMSNAEVFFAAYH